MPLHDYDEITATGIPITSGTLEQEDPELALLFKQICNKELPAFIRHDRVFFKSGREIVENIKVPGRNEKCPCGSGKKYKQCCMNK